MEIQLKINLWLESVGTSITSVGTCAGKNGQRKNSWCLLDGVGLEGYSIFSILSMLGPSLSYGRIAFVIGEKEHYWKQ